jgi:hypothetical protein
MKEIRMMMMIIMIIIITIIIIIIITAVVVKITARDMGSRIRNKCTRIRTVKNLKFLRIRHPRKTAKPS